MAPLHIGEVHVLHRSANRRHARQRNTQQNGDGDNTLGGHGDRCRARQREILWFAPQARLPSGVYADDEYRLVWVVMVVAALVLGMVLISGRRLAVGGDDPRPLAR